MLRLLWLIPFLPLAGFALLTLAGGRMGRRAQAAAGIAPVAAAAALAIGVAIAFIVSPPEGAPSTRCSGPGCTSATSLLESLSTSTHSRW